MLDEHADFLKTTRIEEQIEPFTRGQLAFLVLVIDARLASAEERLLLQILQSLNPVFAH
jgi:hypothetical protein